MKRGKGKSIAFAILGFALLVTGLVLVKAIEDPQGVMRALPFVLIGIGCGALGGNIGELVRQRMIANDPKLAKSIEVEQKDERNQMIWSRAKAKAYDIMIFVHSALLIAFALMGVDAVAIILLAASYLFIALSTAYYIVRYNKEM
jgi:hypothetical protein